MISPNDSLYVKIDQNGSDIAYQWYLYICMHFGAIRNSEFAAIGIVSVVKNQIRIGTFQAHSKFKHVTLHKNHIAPDGMMSINLNGRTAKMSNRKYLPCGSQYPSKLIKAINSSER